MTVNADVDRLEREVQALRREIYGGNGTDGLKVEIMKLRQTVKIATFVAGVIATSMVADFTARFVAISPGDVYEQVERMQAKLDAYRLKASATQRTEKAR